MSRRRQTEPQITAQERDDKLEPTYTYHREHPRETMTEHIAVYRDELALEFFAWTTKQPFPEEQEEMLVRFEEDKFGRSLEPAAHGMLAFAVSYRHQHVKRPFDSSFDSDEQQAVIEKAALDLPNIHGEGIEDRLIRLCGAAGLKLPEEKPKATFFKPMGIGKPLPIEQREVRKPYRGNDDTESIPVSSVSREPGQDDDGDAAIDWLDAPEDL